MSNSILFNPSTKTSVELYLKNPTSCCALIGARGAGKSFAAQFISEVIIADNVEKNPNYIILDATTTGIDEVRVLQKKLSLSVPGHRALKRVVLIEHFDSFGHEAQNALLKTLEEPPMDTVIIITIDHEARVLETIYSRVRCMYIKPISLDIAQNAFKGIYSVQSIEKAFRMSGGSAGLMKSLLESDEEHELVRAIAKSRETLALPKYIRIAKIDSITKAPDLTTLLFLDGLIRLLEASYIQAIVSKKSNSELKIMHNRVENTVNTIADIENGLNPKLALTKLFLEL